MAGPYDPPTSPHPTNDTSTPAWLGEKDAPGTYADEPEGASGADTTHADAAEQLPVVVHEEPKDALGVFGRYLTLWVRAYSR